MQWNILDRCAIQYMISFCLSYENNHSSERERERENIMEYFCSMQRSPSLSMFLSQSRSFYPGISLPAPTSKVHYVNMQHNYINIKDNYTTILLKLCCMSTWLCRMLTYVACQHNYIDRERKRERAEEKEKERERAEEKEKERERERGTSRFRLFLSFVLFVHRIVYN